MARWAGRTVALLTLLTLTGLLGRPTSAQDEAAVVPDPSECRVEARSLRDFVALVGTPVAGTGGDDQAAPPASSFTLPDGSPPDPATLAAITATIRESLACNNAGDFLRAFSLYTDRFMRAFVAEDPLTEEDLAFFASPPRPFPAEEQSALLAVREARVLADGRVGALVDSNDPQFPPDGVEADFVILVAVGDRYLVDEVVEDLEGVPLIGASAATPGTTPATPGAAPAAPTAGLPASDLFDGSSLDPAWSVIRPEAAEIVVADGALSINLLDRALWAGPEQGVLVSQLVSGDFKATVVVHARAASDPASPPAPPVRLGGLMARDPAGGAGAPENYVHIVVGHAPTGIAVETKSTVDSETAYESPAWESGDAELRICRLGATFHLYKRAVGEGSWTLAATHERPDLPATLQVGANAYAVVAPPDLRVTFDEVRLEPVADAAGCETD